jgi:hypothetical protein
MITKRDFAEFLIKDFAEKESVDIYDVCAHPEEYVSKSTSCGIALRYLGYIKDEETLNYLSSRSGIYILSVKGNHILSTEEMFDLLPEEIDEKTK